MTFLDPNDLTDTAADGISHMLRAALPSYRGFVLITFNTDGTGPVKGTCSPRDNPALAIKRLNEAIDAIKKKTGET